MDQLEREQVAAQQNVDRLEHRYADYNRYDCADREVGRPGDVSRLPEVECLTKQMLETQAELRRAKLTLQDASAAVMKRRGREFPVLVEQAWDELEAFRTAFRAASLALGRFSMTMGALTKLYNLLGAPLHLGAQLDQLYNDSRDPYAGWDDAVAHCGWGFDRAYRIGPMKPKFGGSNGK